MAFLPDGEAGMPGRFVSLKTDFGVKELMENLIIRNQLVSDTLKIPMERIRGSRLRNTFLRRWYRRQKLGILDILVELTDGTKINIEMQVIRYKDWDKRVLFYLARTYVSDLEVGEDYSKLKKCIHIGILDFNLTEDEEYHSVYRLRDEKGREFTDQLEIHIIELNKKVRGTDPLDDWIAFFNAESEEELDMLSANWSVGLQEAVRELKRMGLTKQLRLIHEERQKAIRDQKAHDAYVREEGRMEERINTERERQRADQAEAELLRLWEEIRQYRQDSVL